MAKSLAEQLKEAQDQLVAAEAKTSKAETAKAEAEVATADANSRAVEAEQELDQAMARASRAVAATLRRSPKQQTVPELVEAHGPGRMLLARKAGGANGGYTRLKYAWNARSLVKEECHGDLGHVSGSVLVDYRPGQTVLNPQPEADEPLPDPIGALNVPPPGAPAEGADGAGED